MSDNDENFGLVGKISHKEHAKLRKAWQESPAVWRFVPGRGNRKHIRKWLAKLSRDDWHEIALNFDLDLPDLAPLHFIVEQPDCDRASVMTLVLALDLAGQEAKRTPDGGDDTLSNYPEQAQLMDLICKGFRNGLYTEGKFRLGQPQSVFLQMQNALMIQKTTPIWRLPEAAWAPLGNRAHSPEYSWDRSECCQRVPFDTWVRAKLRPN